MSDTITSASTPSAPRTRAVRRGGRVGPVLLATTVLVGGFSLSADAGGGKKPVLAGKTTKSAKTTTIRTTGNGPALKLKTKSSKPPLAVTSRKRVARLNADQVDGFDAADLRTRTLVYRLPSGGTPSMNTSHTFPGLPGGTYVVSYTATLNGNDTMTNGRCYLRQPEADTYAALSYNGTRGTSFSTVSAGAPIDLALGAPVLWCNSSVPFVFEQGEVLFTPAVLEEHGTAAAPVARSKRTPGASRSATGS